MKDLNMAEQMFLKEFNFFNPGKYPDIDKAGADLFDRKDVIHNYCEWFLEQRSMYLKYRWFFDTNSLLPKNHTLIEFDMFRYQIFQSGQHPTYKLYTENDKLMDSSFNFNLGKNVNTTSILIHDLDVNFKDIVDNCQTDKPYHLVNLNPFIDTMEIAKDLPAGSLVTDGIICPVNEHKYSKLKGSFSGPRYAEIHNSSLESEVLAKGRFENEFKVFVYRYSTGMKK